MWKVIGGVPHFDGIAATTHRGLSSDIDRIWIADTPHGEERYVEHFKSKRRVWRPSRAATRTALVTIGVSAATNAALFLRLH